MNLAVEFSLFDLVVSRTQTCLIHDHILRGKEIYGMNLFDRDLDGLSGVIQDFELSSFTNDDIFPPKARHILANTFLVKMFRTLRKNFT